jgi:glutathionylspermidine synthase
MADAEFAALRTQVIFRGAKWDAQVGDVCTIARAPLVLRRSAWNDLATTAERLSAELLEMERELLGRPHLLAKLGLPRALSRVLPGELPEHALRLQRFDFHFTESGVRVSEVNADVPGGLHEGAIADLYSTRLPGCTTPGNVAASLAAAISARCNPSACVALVHATAYSDDRQVMTLLERELARVGLRGWPCAPDHLEWRDGCRIVLGQQSTPVEAVVRFFPAEWLPACPAECDWQQLVRGDALLCNPASCVVVQSKRLPLVWGRLRASSSTWRELLPDTRSTWRAPWLRDSDWLLKPALGRVGQGIVARGLSRPRDFARVALDAMTHPSRYVAQRRFRPLPYRSDGAVAYPCIGVFTLDGRVIGAYGRSSASVFVDHRAVDTPILIAEDAWQESRS